ncbi:hypothetical protein [Fibrobacter sp. UWB10]|uniref:hypothetical protein n=1 Tax=Fibrobacter sp. UWB10 TaxID=1896201 RepID=UPI002402E524|nr:hypothetical protein [Fibrobacter sp. UWB10]SMP39896.1 hypothetical protein SAMN05720465_0397 [Fibrobacter sp. UWB10]
MKKKLIASMSLMAVVGASFWACGEGNINPADTQDELFGGMRSDEMQTELESVKQNCRNDTSFAGCYMRYKAYLDGGETIEEPIVNSSDDSGSNQNPNPVLSSSSRGDIFIVTNPSSSSVLVFDPDPVSSSSGIEIVPVSGLGSCKAATSPISKGQSVNWKFTPNGSNTKYTAMQFASQADYKWNFGGLADDGSGVRATSGKVTYTNSGVANASVTVTMPDGASEVINCTPLQVDGDPITGCKCTSPEPKVDYLTQPDVAWTVSGCVSASEITSYTWDGAAGEATFTKTFDTAQNGYAPTLKVGNADKTVVDVTCTTVKTTKGSEFTFEKQDTKIALPAGESSVEFDLPATWHGSTEGNCTFRCDGANQPITITIGTDSSKPDYSATMSIPVAKTINKTAMTITLDVAANCQVGY